MDENKRTSKLTQAELFRKFLNRRHGEHNNKPDEIKDMEKPKRKLTQLEKTRREISFYKNKQKLERAKRDLRYYKREYRYQQSRGGVVSRALIRGARFIRNPIKRSYTEKPTERLRKADRENLRLQIALMKMQQKQQQNRQIQYRYITPQQARYNYVFRGGDFTAPALEQEVFNYANGGVSNDGDKVARQINKEVFFAGNLNTVSPMITVAKEAAMHANLQHINPLISVENEALAFANILQLPSKFSRQKGKR